MLFMDTYQAGILLVGSIFALNTVQCYWPNTAVPKPAFIVQYNMIKQDDSDIFCSDEFNEQKIGADEQCFGVLYKYVFR